MAYAYVQGSTHQNGSTASTTVAVTLAAAVGSGNSLMVSVGNAGPPPFNSVTDDKGNSYISIDSTNTGNYYWSTFACFNITNAPQTITATCVSSVQFGTIMVDEFSGLGTAVDTHGINVQTRGTVPNTTDAITSGTVTTVANGDFIYGSCVSVNSDNVTTGTGYTADQAVITTFFSEHLTQASAGSTAATFSPTGAGQGPFLTAIIAVRPPGYASGTYVQGSTHQNGSTSSTTCAVTLVNPVGTGDLLCVSFGSVASGGTPDTVTVTDDKSNVYTHVDSAVDTTASYQWQSFFCAGITNGPKTITATDATGAVTYAAIMVDEFNVNLMASPLDGHAINDQNPSPTGTDGVTSGTYTTTVNGDFIYGATVDVSSLGGTAVGTGNTGCQSIGNTFYGEFFSQLTAGAGTASTFTHTYASTHLTSSMAFKIVPVTAAALAPVLLVGVPVGRMANYKNLLNAPLPVTVVAPPITGSTLPMTGVG